MSGVGNRVFFDMRWKCLVTRPSLFYLVGVTPNANFMTQLLSLPFRKERLRFHTSGLFLRFLGLGAQNQCIYHLVMTNIAMENHHF